MGPNKNKIIVGLLARLSAVMLLLQVAVPGAHARLYFTNDLFKNEAETFRIGHLDDTDANDLTLEFGSTNTETLSWVSSGDLFSLSNTLAIGATSETIADAAFTLDDNDLFVAGQLGVEGGAYFDGNVDIDAASDFVIGSTGLTETNGAGDNGATLIGVDQTEFSNSTSTNVQDVLDDFDALLGGGGSAAWDDVYDNSSANAVLEIDDTHDVTFNLTATSDFYFQDGGSNVFELNDSGAAVFTPTSGQDFSVTTAGAGDVVLTDPDWSITGAGAGSFTSLATTGGGDANIDGDVTVGSSTETIANAGFTLDGDDLFVADNVGVEDDIYVEGSVFTDTYASKYIWFQPAGAVRTSAALGTVDSGNSPALRFDGTNASNGVWSFAVPDDADLTANMTLTVFWSPEDGNSGNVVFSLDYGSYGSGEVIGTGTETDSTSTTVAAPGTTLQVVSSDMTLTESNISIDSGDMIHIDLGRDPGDASDTYAGEISVHSVRITYQGKKLQ